MAVKDNTTRMHDDIKRDFEKMCRVQAHGVQKYTNEYIYREIAHKYYKSWKTVENIVFNRTAVHYTSAQGSLFSTTTE